MFLKKFCFCIVLVPLPPANVKVTHNKNNPATQLDVSFVQPDCPVDKFIISVINENICFKKEFYTSKTKCCLLYLKPGQQYDIFALSVTGKIRSKETFIDTITMGITTLAYF